MALIYQPRLIPLSLTGETDIQNVLHIKCDMRSNQASRTGGLKYGKFTMDGR